MKAETAARKIAEIVLHAMVVKNIPIDSCVMTSEIACYAARELGFRARVVPCRIVAVAPRDKEGAVLGFWDDVKEDRYNGHCVAVVGNVIVDITAAQIGDGVPSPLIFEAPKRFKPEGTIATVAVNGFRIAYMPFNDGGDYLTDGTGETRSISDLTKTARLIAERVNRKGR